MDNQTSNRTKYILLTLGVATTGTLGYLGWAYWQKKKAEKSTDEFPELPESKADTTSNSYVPLPPPNSSDGFPIKKGNRGAKVKALQEALIAKYGKSVLPKWGADGDYGSELETALKKYGINTSVDESTYNLLVKGNAPEGALLAQQLVAAAISSNFNAAMAALKQLRNTSDYTSVSNAFKEYRVRGVHQTLVNGLLNSFTDAAKKDQIRNEFLRMGLKYDGNKWALNGLDEFGFLLNW